MLSIGIKATGGQLSVDSPTREASNGKTMTVAVRFGVFESLSQAFDEHDRLFATAAVYKDAMAKAGNPAAFADALTGTYATDPNYGYTLIWVMQNYSLGQYNR